jgi:hypothetical protein
MKYTDPSGEIVTPTIDWSLINNKIANAVNIAASKSTVTVVSTITPFAYGATTTTLPFGMYCLNYSLNMAVNIFFPPIIIGNEDFGLIISPSLTPNTFLFNFNFYLNIDNINANIGFNTQGNTFVGVNYNFENGGKIGWYRTDFAGNMPQGVGGVIVGGKVFGKNLTFRLDEDHRYLLGDGDDRYRSGGFELTVGNFVMSGRVTTNDISKKEEQYTHNEYITPAGKIKSSKVGVYDYGKVYDSQLSFGYKTKYGVINFEHHNNVYQDGFQNGFHKWWGTPYFQSEYFDYHNLGIYRSNPYSIYYY